MKLKCAIMFMAVSFITFACFGVLVHLPESDVLQIRLDDLEMTHFARVTDIIQQLAGKKRHAVGVVMEIDTALEHYNKGIKIPIAAWLMQERRSDVIKAFLEDDPEVIEELRVLRIL